MLDSKKLPLRGEFFWMWTISYSPYGFHYHATRNPNEYPNDDVARIVYLQIETRYHNTYGYSPYCYHQ